MHTTESNHPSVTLIATIFAALFVLLGLTVGAAQVNLGRWNFVVAMLIASAKASLIMQYFMQMKYARSLIRLFAFSSFLWLAVLFSLIFCDVLTR
jgi:cytochrome c oxidase subunit 4